MDWTKIKAKHFLFTNFTLKDHGALARLLCLTAHLERMPLESEMRQLVHYKALMHLQCTLNDQSTTLQYVLNKVLEDVQGIEHKRKISRETTTRYRKKGKSGDVSCDTTEERRGEEIREDNIKKARKEFLGKVHERLYQLYPRKIGKTDALRHMKRTVVTDQDIQDCEKAIFNYIEENKLKDKEFLKHASSFFNDRWRDYVEIEMSISEKKELEQRTDKINKMMGKVRIPDGTVATTQL